MYSFIKLAHLPALGIEKKYFFFVILFVVIVFSYSIIQPLITWLVSLKFNRLLSYIVSSLVIFNAVSLIMIWRPEWIDSTIIVFKLGFQIVALFGIGLITYYLLRRLVERIKENYGS